VDGIVGGVRFGAFVLDDLDVRRAPGDRRDERRVMSGKLIVADALYLRWKADIRLLL
jgi:hypothetical protein